ncbi:MAG: DUF167 domain-containing protein [Rhodocyclaceae bacterium]|nr:DUF167 domain-containing protein [Rhodocyclaceae bacterium]
MNAGHPWLRQAADGSVTLSLHIQPGASRTQSAGLHGEALKLRLAAPPVDGKANTCLVAFLAEFLGCPKSTVELVSGASSRQKRVRIAGLSAAALDKLRALAGD